MREIWLKEPNCATTPMAAAMC
ncbi:hypothetical protein Golob_004718 [Gossypium lobatum]|uniref:Uncharacterized protein n=1 Tax=Gossypium lobatum TaxID=34289 RepID=A0A7J8N2A1_9ROSI|nr:hypothetical protein [Gossypium lobatum]